MRYIYERPKYMCMYMYTYVSDLCIFIGGISLVRTMSIHIHVHIFRSFVYIFHIYTYMYMYTYISDLCIFIGGIGIVGADHEYAGILHHYDLCRSVLFFFCCSFFFLRTHTCIHTHTHSRTHTHTQHTQHTHTHTVRYNSLKCYFMLFHILKYDSCDILKYRMSHDAPACWCIYFT